MIRVQCWLVVVVLCMVSVLPAASSDNPYPMRWRIFVDTDSQTSFRYPYDYRTPDQYAARFLRPGSTTGSQLVITGSTANLTPDQVAELVRQARESSGTDLWHVAATGAELVGIGEDPAAVLGHLSEGRLTSFEEFDYYSAVEQRPHADPKWAPEGVVAMLGSGPEHCGILLQHGDQRAAIIATGSITDHDNLEIFNTFEVMHRQKERDPFMTWREMQTRINKNVIGASGRPVSIRSRDEKATWDQAWEVETANYHITCTVSPAKTYYFAMLMESLYREFAAVFKPEEFPPFKMEIHVQHSQAQFARMANANGFGSVAGALGFFSPGRLCIYAYDRGPNAGDMGVDKTLAHEASHQFLHVTCNGSSHVPTWLNEGLAVYFESGKFKGGKYIWGPPATRMAQLKVFYAQEKKTVQPLDQYLNHYGHIPAISYAEVYAMTHFWIFGVKEQKGRNGEIIPGGRERFVTYWNALKDGENGTEAFDRIFMNDMIEAKGGREHAIREWEKMMLAYVAKSLPMKRPRN